MPAMVIPHSSTEKENTFIHASYICDCHRPHMIQGEHVLGSHVLGVTCAVRWLETAAGCPAHTSCTCLGVLFCHNTAYTSIDFWKIFYYFKLTTIFKEWSFLVAKSSANIQSHDHSAYIFLKIYF